MKKAVRWALFIAMQALFCRGEVSMDIPYLGKGLTVDGDLSKWQKAALSFPLVANNKGEQPDSSRFAAWIQLGWNEVGLWVGVEVKDSQIYDGGKQIWNDDHVSVFLSNGVGGNDKIQWVVAPGLTEKHSDVWFVSLNQRGSRPLTSEPIRETIVRKKTADGYALEMLFPLENVGVKAQEGATLGLNLLACDKTPETETALATLEWNGYGDSHAYLRGVNELRLAKRASVPPPVTVKSFLEDEASWKIRVLADIACTGRTAEVVWKDQKAQSVFKESCGRAVADLVLTMPPVAPDWPAAQIFVVGKPADEIHPLMARVEYKEKPKQPFRCKVNRYLREDQINPYPDGGIVFCGHSQIDMWEPLHADMMPMSVLNRGMSGSKSSDLLQYADELVLRHRPSAVVCYTGSNDFGIKKTPEEITENLVLFFRRVREACPDAKAYMILPPENEDYSALELLRELNRRVADAAQETGLFRTIDCTGIFWSLPKGSLNDMRKYDHVHLNEKAYATLAPVIRQAISEK